MPPTLILICHGVGANGRNMAPLAEALAPYLPGAVFETPDAPEEYDMYPDMGGRQWFSLSDRSPSVLTNAIRHARAALDAIIDAALARHRLPPDAYALVGFSQGAMMVLHTGLRRAVPPHAIVAISGALVDRARLAVERTNKVPILLVHGELDQVVPPGASREAERTLSAAGLAVKTLFRPTLGHEVDEEGLSAAGTFLARSI